MKAAHIVGVVLAGAMSTGMVLAENQSGGKLDKMRERWEKRNAQKEEIREKISSEIKKQDEDLLKVQSDLKSAPSDKKVDALSAAVNTLIDQRLKMHKQMESFSEKLRSDEKWSSDEQQPEAGAGSTPATRP